MGVIDMRTVHLSVAPEYEPGSWKAQHDLAVRVPGDLRRTRFTVYFMDHTTTCRRHFGGPMLPGPHAYAIRHMDGMLCDSSRECLMIEIGEHVEIGGEIFQVDYADRVVELNWIRQGAGVSI